jgi:putative Mn2+ efflux pump MntP
VLVLPVLARAKLRLAGPLQSSALRGDGILSLAGAALASATLASLLLDASLGWWWSDAVAALVIAATLLGEALGVAGLDPRRRLRVSLLMAGFEAGMPLVGLALGAPLGHAVGSAADYIAIGVLLAFGLYALVARDNDEEDIGKLASATGWGAIALGVSISLDEFAIGFTLGLLRLPAAVAIILIGAQAFVLSQLGLRLGARVGSELREGAERLAGLALTALGLGLLIEKIASG